jgi:hypothetical protein
MKFTLVFDEEIDGPELVKMKQGNNAQNIDDIESDDENE